MNETINLLLELCNQPILKTGIMLAKTAKVVLEGDPVQKVIQVAGKSQLKAAMKAIDEAEWSADQQGAAHEILTHLRSAYYFYVDYYERMPKRWDTHIPYLWVFNEFHVGMRRTDMIEDTICQICFLMAVYHKALGDDPELVKEWLCEKEFSCNNYKILESLLGQEIALEYIASHPLEGNYIAKEYLYEEGISLEDYYGAVQTDSDGISFGMEDPIVYLD